MRRCSIKQRLFGFVLLPSILMLICFMFYYMFSQSVISTKNEQASSQLVSMAQENVSLNALRLKESVDEITTLDQMSELIHDPGDANALEHIQKLFANLKSTLIRLYDKEGTLLGVYGEERTSKTKLNDQEQTWYYDEKEQSLMYLGSVFQSGECIGYVSVYFPMEVFAPSIALSKNSANGSLLILDEYDQVLFGQGNIAGGSKVEVQNGKAMINDEIYYVSMETIKGLDWKIADVVSQNYVYEEIHNFRDMILLYCLIALVVLLIFSTITYHSLHDPIDHMLQSMEDFSENNLNAIRVEDQGRDELHILSQSFNELLTRIDELLKTVSKEQEQKRETQIQLLQAQINPHFLFNTLNTLRYLAILNEDKPVSEGISALAKLLRNTIVDSNEMVSVQEEIENVKNYIIIQKLRYGDLFETVYNIDDDVKYHKILKFLLQPIVENSILHAFEEDREHQILTIRAKAWHGYLRIEIGDNGKGFDMWETQNSKKKLSSIGMKNIQERIQLMYGDAYSMKVESVIDVGTITTLLLPLQS